MKRLSESGCLRGGSQRSPSALTESAGSDLAGGCLAPGYRRRPSWALGKQSSFRVRSRGGRERLVEGLRGFRDREHLRVREFLEQGVGHPIEHVARLPADHVDVGAVVDEYV